MLRELFRIDPAEYSSAGTTVGTTTTQTAAVYSVLKLARVLPIVVVFLDVNFVRVWHMAFLTLGLTTGLLNAAFPDSSIATAALCVGVGSSYTLCFAGKYIATLSQGRPALAEKLQFQGLFISYSTIGPAMILSGFVYDQGGWVSIAACVTAIQALQLVIIGVASSQAAEITTSRPPETRAACNQSAWGTKRALEDADAEDEGEESLGCSGLLRESPGLMWTTLFVAIGTNAISAGAQALADSAIVVPELVTVV